jgi:sugar/nucleoside kinase (ribokinase family)
MQYLCKKISLTNKLSYMNKVLGLGNALVDMMTMIENDTMLNDFNLPKGSMQLVDKDTADFIIKATNHLNKKLASGGSAANTIHGLSNLGVSTGYIGKIGRDELGEFFKKDMMKNNIEPKMEFGTVDTGCAIALVSPDSERTFATYLGAAVEISEADIHPSQFEDYSHFHIEGYLVQNHALLEKAVKTAKDKNLVISLDLASYNVVEANIDFLRNIMLQYVDIVFANEEEAKAFTGSEPESALIELSNHCEIAVVKTGKNGSLVKKGDNIHTVGIIPVNSIDTTGAGDLYASGFLYGLIHNLSLDKCGKIGAILAGHVIEEIGAKMSDLKWVKSLEMINKVKN